MGFGVYADAGIYVENKRLLYSVVLVSVIESSKSLIRESVNPHRR